MNTFLSNAIKRVNGSSAIWVDERRNLNLYGIIEPPRWNTGIDANVKSTSVTVFPPWNVFNDLTSYQI